jgi:iron complex transport system substrate-binding protein
MPEIAESEPGSATTPAGSDVPMSRVVSLIASATEIVCALGLEKLLVGRSHECDYPHTVTKLPVCTQPRIRVDATSREIDSQIKDVLRAGLSVYQVDSELLYSLRPDVIITQMHCDVCAVSEADVERVLPAWPGEKPRIVALTPNSLADVWADIDRVARALGVEAKGKSLVRKLSSAMHLIEAKSRRLAHSPSVACIEWIDPLMAAGNWVPELVSMAGGSNLFGVAGAHAPTMTWEELRQKDPDVIAVIPCGLDLGRTCQEAAGFKTRPGWSALQAVRSRRVYLADGNQYFNRPGPRLLESLEILAEMLHPEAFHFGHERCGWVRFEDGDDAHCS